jgi:hypothetical protein
LGVLVTELRETLSSSSSFQQSVTPTTISPFFSVTTLALGNCIGDICGCTLGTSGATLLQSELI